MSKGLKGQFNHTIDTKGRLIIPSKLREQLGLTFVVTRGQDGCLDAYPNDEWEKIEEKLNSLPSIKKSVRDLQRFYRAGAMDCEIDNQGRILLSPTLREFANLEKDVVIIGNGTKAEIWDKDVWEKSNAIESIDFDSMEDIFEQSGISF